MIIILSLMLSCKPNEKSNIIDAPIKEYPFNFVQNTGICTQIIDNKSLVNIKYHENSDKENLELFLALKWHIISASSEANDDSRIVIIGRLSNKIKTTKQCESCPEPEVYREFELVDWYLKVPFNQIIYNGKPPKQLMDDPEKIRIIEREELIIEDFIFFERILKLNLNKHILINKKSKNTVPNKKI